MPTYAPRKIKEAEIKNKKKKEKQTEALISWINAWPLISLGVCRSDKAADELSAVMKECQENKTSKGFLNFVAWETKCAGRRRGRALGTVQRPEVGALRSTAASLETMATLRGEVFPSLTLRRPSGSLQNVNGPNRGP